MSRERPIGVLMLLENHAYPQDGRVRGEATTLTAAGYRVTVISPKAAGQRWRDVVDGVQVYRLPEPPQADSALGYVVEYLYAMGAAFTLSLWVYLRHGFDIVHAHNPPDTFVAIAAFYKLLGKRFIFDHHDLSPEMYDARFEGGGRPFVRRLLVLCEQLSCRMADHVIATNASYKAIEMGRGRVPEARITIVRNGPNLDQFVAPPPVADPGRDGRTVIGYAGVMGRQDGVEHLLVALHHLRVDLGRHQFRCVLVGAGDALADLQALAARLDLTEHVEFVGWCVRADVARHLSVADICVAPEPSNAYTDRSTMIKLMEYMALAKPTVAFDLPEHRVTANAAAVYVPANDERAFAQAIADLMDAPDRRLAMGRAGRQRIERELAWSYSAAHLLGAYQMVVHGRRDTTSAHTSDLIEGTRDTAA